MRTRKELWAIPKDRRDSVVLTPEEEKELARGYAITAEAMADYFGTELVWEIANE